MPLETNLEKDTKVVQHEQKKFLQQHKVRIESYHKAASTLKKQRKKKTNAEVSEKEMKVSVFSIVFCCSNVTGLRMNVRYE